MPELILIMAIALIVIGPKKLPDLAKALGRALGEFKRATSDLKDSLEIDTGLSDVKRSFDDMNKNLKKDLYKKALGDSNEKTETVPRVQVPPEPYLDKVGQVNGTESERNEAADPENGSGRFEKLESSEMKPEEGELPEKKDADSVVSEEEAATAAEPELNKNGETNEKQQ